MVGATTSLLFLTARRFLSAHAALVLAFAFAFGTSAWSTASRALWQHTPSMLLLAAALWIAVKALDRPALIQFASIPLSLAFCVRPTNAVAAAVFTVLVAVHYRRWLAPYILYAILAAAAFFA